MADRILIFGVTGSGKSTLAAQLAASTGLPWYDVDERTWRPGWVPVPEPEQRAQFAAIAAEPQWILDTAYDVWRDVVLPHADLIVALDYSRRVSLGRLLRRTVARVVDKRPICNGNVETVRGSLGRDSIIRWHFSSFTRKHRTIEAWVQDPSMPAVIRLRTPLQTERWLRSLTPAAGVTTRPGHSR